MGAGPHPSTQNPEQHATDPMLADIAIIPIGHGAHTSETLAGVLKIIKDSGLPYQLTPTSTCLEGSWTEVMAVVKQCHDFARGDAPHVVTLLRIEEDMEQGGKLARNVASVEAEAGEKFKKSPDPTATAAPSAPGGVASRGVLSESVSG